MSDSYSFDTKIVHSFSNRKEWHSFTQTPIYQNVAASFDTLEELSDAFLGKTDSFIYQRLKNPTNKELETKLASLEGGIGAIVTSSGMAAITASILAIVKSGDEIVSSNSLFMSTFLLFSNVLKKFGVTARFVEPTELHQWENSITDKTKLFYLETIGNPKMDVPHIKAIADIAHKNSIPLIVDNTLATAYLVKPFELGADIVVHSTTKYLNGHGSALGGVVVDSGKFSWPKEKFPDFQMYKDKKGEYAYLDKLWREIYINFGLTQSPFHSYLTLLGIETLSVRMERHLKNAMQLASFLNEHSEVKWVNYPGLRTNKFHQIATKQFKAKGYGALLTFGLKDYKSASKFINSLKLVCNLANIGDTRTLVIHPWSSQYVNFPDDIKLSCGITEGLIRVSVGIEDINDIINDFDQALKGVNK